MPFKDKDAQREYQRKWIAARRAEWLKEHGPCIKCGSWDELEVDHIDPEKKLEHRIWSWTKERRDKELEKCQILCRKHHEEKTGKENSRPIPHGTDCGYTYHECRCEPCGKAHSEKRKLDKELYDC